MTNIVVTGASRGLGLEFVKQLSKFSFSPNVFALCRDPQGAEKLQNLASSSSNVTIIKADMTDFSNYNNVVSDIERNIISGGVNLLVNNAGMMIKDDLKSVKYQNIMSSYELNAVAPLLFTQSLLPLLKKANPSGFPFKLGTSIILNVSAQLGSIGENDGAAWSLSYRLSKAALNMATKCMATELKSSQIFAISLHPGWVQTDMGGKQAPITPEGSVSGMLKVLSGADSSYNGSFFNEKGRKIPW